MNMEEWKQQRELDRQRREERAQQIEREQRDKEEQIVKGREEAKQQRKKHQVEEYVLAHPEMVALTSCYRNGKHYYLNRNTHELFSVDMFGTDQFTPVESGTEIYRAVTAYNKQTLDSHGISLLAQEEHQSDESSDSDGEPK